MPAYYPRPGAREQPLTPPDYLSAYSNGSCAAPYVARSWSGSEQPSSCVSDTYYTPRSSVGPQSTVVYQQPGYAMNHLNVGPITRYYDPLRVSTLAPMHRQDQSAMVVGSGSHSSRHEYQSKPTTQPKEEKSVGGVSAKLDYELNVMTDFMVEMTQAIISPGRTILPAEDFRQWIHAMLSATRLPSSTIAMALHYLTIRMAFMTRRGTVHVSREQTHTMITVSLTLGSKFLDDNTFINRSWSDVSGIKVHVLNQEELDWLVSMNWILHRDPNEENGFESWRLQWLDYQSRAVARAEHMSRNKLAPIDTSIQRHGPVHTLQSAFNASPPDMLSRVNNAQFSAKGTSAHFAPLQTPWSYDQWAPRRPSLEHSPASAPHTGPTTPEFYSGGSAWNHPEGYSRRTMFGPQPVSHVVPQPQPFVQEQYPHYAAAWNGHGMSCVCLLCNHQQQPSYISGACFSSQSVAA